MSATITYPADGRGAWPATGKGGTLSLDGKTPGRFYRHAITPATTIGVNAYRADREGTETDIDQYAVWRAAAAIQTELKDLGYLPTGIDGLWGKGTSDAVIAWQNRMGLTPDGVYGPASAKAMFVPAIRRYAIAVDAAQANSLTRIVTGTINLESGWDPGAVGSDPNDLGLGQINGPAHPTMSVNDRLNPRLALPWIVRFIDGNLTYFKGDTDLAIAAYNLGRTGATRWRDAGKPDVWVVNGSPRNIRDYINKILNGGTI